VILGVDMGGTNTKAVRLSGAGELIESRQWPTRAGDAPRAWMNTLIGQLGDWVDAELPALGLSVAGLVGPERRIERAPNLPQFEGFDFRAALAQKWPHLRVAVENDVNCAVFGEHLAGAAKGKRFVVMLSMGTGVGGGLVLDGQLYRGVAGMGAELGHTVLDPNGPPCKCGLRGHVESYLGAVAIGERLAALASHPRGQRLSELGREIGYTPESLSKAAREGDALALEIWEELGEWLGRAFANLVHIFNPEICLVGGGIASAGELLLEPARRSLRANSIAAASAHVELKAAALGPYGAAIGAALLAGQGGATLDA
jgi:glucokinase